ncbi:MAG: MBL fold metallo-hydrolase [Gemmiger sp.]|uniref:MBL fold metallo-hydrolase n=1 Tax=Gemmiger sp. TaxID=2049027 RepID=UPI002E7A1E27|nr:MBL fold metallo-hydrolase [Gemmiger sp.]MEE0801320.1 MBL fold metallo-hydrolase [Gemmiger sp.]
MALFTTLYSGSSGNCALIRQGEKYLLVDMGKSCRTTLNALRRLNLAVSDCEGILITHEHSDHVSGLDTFLKHYTVPVYGCADTLDTLYSRGTIPPAVEAIAMDGRTEEIGGFTVTSFPTSHDVPCCGYRIRTPDERTMAIATDLGTLTPVVQQSLAGCDLVALEANYDAFSLHGGPYPYYLKVRIASDRGHLDNKACAAELLDLIQDGCKKFALCHLSQTNNSPELVMTTVYNVLLSAGIDLEKDLTIQAQLRNDISPYIEF